MEAKISEKNIAIEVIVERQRERKDRIKIIISLI